jgi:hypothetical protein
MRDTLYFLFCLVLAGCSTTSSVKFSSTAESGQASFIMLDERNSNEKISRFEENSDGKNYFFGDDNINPTPSKLLENKFKEELNNELSGKKVTLTDFTIHVYEPEVYIDRNAMDSATSFSPEAALVAPLAEIFISAIEGMKSEKNLLVQVSGDVNGSTFSSTLQESFKGRVTENNAKQTINKVLEDLVSQVRVIVAKPALSLHSSE